MIHDEREQNLDQRQKVTLKLKKITAAHEEVQHKKKITNNKLIEEKQHLNEEDYLKRYHQDNSFLQQNMTFK